MIAKGGKCQMVYYDVNFKLTDDSIDEEMNNNINKIIATTGWTKEEIINNAIQFGCKWFLKDQLNFIVNHQLGERS